MTAPLPPAAPPADPTGGKPSGPAAGPPSEPTSGTDRGYPENTPLDRMTGEQREAYWKYHARKHEERANQAPTPQELAELREKAGKYDQHEQAQMTELEKANATIAELQKKVRASDLAEMRWQAAKAAGLPADDAEFITATTPEDAKTQAERLKARLGATSNGATGHDQGHRRQQPVSARERGLAEAQRRFGKTAQTTA